MQSNTHIKVQAVNFAACTFSDVYKRQSENSEKNNEEHQEITKAFLQLRKVEEKVRNLVAHEITNIDELKIQKFTQGTIDKGLKSAQILQLLHRTTKLIRGEDVHWDYDQLNEKIIESL